VNLFQKPEKDSMHGTEKKGAHIKDYRTNAKTDVVLDVGSVCNAVGSVRNALHGLRFSSLDLQGHNPKLNRANKK
jgi:hypothetical protein